MRKQLLRCGVLICGCALVLSSARALMAQSMWVPMPERNSFALEISLAQFDGGSRTDLTAWVFAPSLKMMVSDGLAFKVEVPFAHGSYQFSSSFASFDESETAFGNPYVGLEIAQPNSNLTFDFGARLPVAQQDKDIANVAGTGVYIDRFLAFTPDVLTIDGMLNFRSNPQNRLVGTLRFGPELAIITDSGGDDVELFFLYSGMVGVQNQQIRVLAGISGLLLATGDDLDFDQRTLHQLNVAISFTVNNIRPGIHFRLPLDEDYFVDFVFGAHAAIAFGE